MADLTAEQQMGAHDVRALSAALGELAARATPYGDAALVELRLARSDVRTVTWAMARLEKAIVDAARHAMRITGATAGTGGTGGTGEQPPSSALLMTGARSDFLAIEFVAVGAVRELLLADPLTLLAATDWFWGLTKTVDVRDGKDDVRTQLSGVLDELVADARRAVDRGLPIAFSYVHDPTDDKAHVEFRFIPPKR